MRNAAQQPQEIAPLTAARAAAAHKLWRQVVNVLRPLAASGDSQALQLLSSVLCAAGRAHEAAQLLSSAVRQDSSLSNDVGLLKQLGDCLLQDQQWQRAFNAYQTALHTAREQQGQQGTTRATWTEQNHVPSEPTAQCQHEQQQEQQEASPVCVLPQGNTLDLLLQASCAAALYPQGGPQAEAAVHLLQSILQQQEGRRLPTALRLCAQVAVDRQDWAAGAQAAVELLALEPQDKRGARLLALSVQEPAGMEGLQSAVVHSSKASPAATAAALVFLASKLLSCSALPEAVRLYQQATCIDHKSSRCALGLAQALEVQCNSAGVLQALLGFCQSNPEHHLGQVPLQAVLQFPLLHALSQRNLPLGSLGWYLTAQPMQHSRTCQAPSNSSIAGVGKLGTEQQQQQQQGLSQQEKTAIGHGNDLCSGFAARLQLGCSAEQHGQQGLQIEAQEQQQQCAGGTAPAQQLLQKQHPGPAQLADQPQTAAATHPPESPPCAVQHQQALAPTQQEGSLCEAQQASNTTITTAAAPQPDRINNAPTTGCLSAAVAVAPSAAAPSAVAPSTAELSAAAPSAAAPSAAAPSAVAPLAVAPHAVAPSAAAPHSQAATVDLDLLALLFTAAKVLFCGGALQQALQLLQLCRPAQEAAAAAVQPLHQSRIRNEAAYAALLQKLLVAAPPELGPSSEVNSCRVLFVCGDSHILPLAWRTLSIRGTQHLLVPLLVTGCKVWHMRAGSTHPAAHQFEAAMAAVPRGGRVLLLLGEIDCREGLLLAVEKMKYDSLEEAVAATAGVYVALVTGLVVQRVLHVLVHCVPPVLPETRHTVKLFNDVFKQQLTLQVGQQPEAAGRLQFLDVQDVLLKHMCHLELDGSHLHPDYLHHLQAAVNRLN